MSLRGWCRYCGFAYELDADGNLEPHVNAMAARRCYGSGRKPVEVIDDG